MRGNLNILKSKYIKLFILAAIIMAAAAGLAMNLQQGGEELSPEEMNALTGEKFETVFPVGRYKEIYIASASEGLFVVGEKGSFSLVDKDGNVLSDLPYSHVQEHSGSSFIMVEKGRRYCINAEFLAETGQLPQKGYDRAELDKTGRYIIVKDGGRFMVNDAEGALIYMPKNRGEGGPGPYFMGPEGYIIERDAADRQYIVNIQTGKTEYRVPENIRVSDFRAGMWFMDCADEHEGLNFSYYYALDEEYNLTAGKGVFTAVNIGNGDSEKYVSLQQEPDVTYENRDVLADRKLFDGRHTVMKAVYNNSGEMVYGGRDENSLSEKHGEFIRHIRGNLMAVSGYNETVIDYINLDTGEVISEDSEIFCLMDFDDGAAAAAVNISKNLDRDDRSGDMIGKENKMDDYDWGLVDNNLNPLTEFVFDGVYPGDMGYAIVIKDGQKGMIRLKEAGQHERNDA